MDFNYFLFLTDGILGASELRGPVNYKYNVLKSATKNFSEENKLGEGGFGEVYKVRKTREKYEIFENIPCTSCMII